MIDISDDDVLDVPGAMALLKIGRDARRDHSGDRAHLLDQRLGRFVEQIGIRSRQHDRHVAPGSTSNVPLLVPPPLSASVPASTLTIPLLLNAMPLLTVSVPAPPRRWL